MDIHRILQRKGVETGLILAAVGFGISLISWFDPRPCDPFEYWVGNIGITFSLVVGAFLYSYFMRKGTIGMLAAFVIFLLVGKLFPNITLQYSLLIWIPIAVAALYVFRRLNIRDVVDEEGPGDELTLLNLHGEAN